MPVFEMPLQQINVSPLDSVKEDTIASTQNQDRKVQEFVLTISSQHPPERCASQASARSNNHDICRICHCEGDSELPLIAPCICAGSLRYVHQACLQRWIKSSAIQCCELCKFKFIMQSQIKPFSEWQTLEMSDVERRECLCSVICDALVVAFFVWSVYTLTDLIVECIYKGYLYSQFWPKLVTGVPGFIGSSVILYYICIDYLNFFRLWKSFNRVIFVQNAPENVALPPSNSQPPVHR
jgi:E3 ubiquitin-protein ligase MARCH1/8